MFKIEKHYFLTLVYVPLITAFFLIERFVTPKYIIYCTADFYIPYIKYFVFFYFSWFLYMFAATAYFMFVSKNDFLRLTAFMSIGMAVSLAIFVIFPNAQPLRPSNTGGGLAGALIAWLYVIDTPTNVCPSIHVINSAAVHICISKSPVFFCNRIIKSISFFIMVMINLSTMFIKQHSIIDVLFGLVVTLIVYGLVFGLMFNPKDKKQKVPSY